MCVTDTLFRKLSRRSPWLVAMVLAVAGCSGGPDDDVPRALLEETARSLTSDTAITPEQLSDAVIGGNRPLLVIDLRPVEEYRQGTVKGARNLAPAQLLSAGGRPDIVDGTEMVLLSGDGVLASQVSALLRLSGIQARVLAGGVDAWQAYLSPGPGTPGMDRATARDHAKRQAAACWFEGDYVAAAGLLPRAEQAVGSEQAGGYVPPLEPAGKPKTDALGLGLGLGLGPPPEQTPPKKKQRKLKVREGC